MTPFAISGLLVGLSFLSLGIFVYFKDRKNKVHQLYLLWSISVTIYGFGSWKIGSTPPGEETIAFLWWSLTHIGIIFIPIFFLHFVYLWLGRKRKRMVLLAYFQGFFFLAFNLYDLLVGKSSPGFFIKLRWVFDSLYWPTANPFDLYWIYIFIWVFLVLYAHYELLRVYKKSSGIKRAQIKYFLLGTVLGYSGGSSCYLPCFGINVYPYLNFTVVLYPLFTSYAIVRYRFMDVRMIIGRVGVYILSFLTILAYAFSLLFLNYNFNIVSSTVLSIFIVITVIPLFYYALRLFEKIAAKFFYYTLFSLQQTLRKLGKELNRTIKLNELTNLISRSLLGALKLDKAGIILREPKEEIFKVQQAIKLNKEDLSSLLAKGGSFLLKYLQETKEPLVREEIPFITRKMQEVKTIEAREMLKQEVRELTLLKQDMDRLEIGLFLPLFMEEKLIGVIVLGNKLSGEAYSVQDLDLLSALASQAAVAFNNALSYEEIEVRKADLEKFYKLIVGRELRMVELKKKIKELEERN